MYQGRNEFFVNCHVQVSDIMMMMLVNDGCCDHQDIPENGADVAHLDAVHSASIILGGEPTQELEDRTSCLTR